MNQVLIDDRYKSSLNMSWAIARNPQSLNVNPPQTSSNLHKVAPNPENLHHDAEVIHGLDINQFAQEYLAE